MSELEIRDETHGQRHTLVLTGELDGTTAHALRTVMVGLCEGDATEIVLDLRKLDFIDWEGVQEIVASQQRAREHGCEFFLTPGRQAIARLFELVGLDRDTAARQERQPSHSDAAG